MRLPVIEGVVERRLLVNVVTTGFFALWAYAFRGRRRDRDPGASGSAQPQNVS